MIQHFFFFTFFTCQMVDRYETFISLCTNLKYSNLTIYKWLCSTSLVQNEFAVESSELLCLNDVEIE